MKKYLLPVMCLAMLPAQSFATELKLFVGGNVGLSGIVLSSGLKDDTHDDTGVTIMDLPTSFFGLGGEFGLMFIQPAMYNYGVTLAYDHVFSASADINPDYKTAISSVKIGFSAISATFDNYLRVVQNRDRRDDIVLGVGIANIHETFKSTSSVLPKTESDDGFAIVFKAGYDIRVGNHQGYINARYFLPVDGDNDRDIDGLYNINAGLRYLF